MHKKRTLILKTFQKMFISRHSPFKAQELCSDQTKKQYSGAKIGSPNIVYITVLANGFGVTPHSKLAWNCSQSYIAAYLDHR